MLAGGFAYPLASSMLSYAQSLGRLPDFIEEAINKAIGEDTNLAKKVRISSTRSLD